MIRESIQSGNLIFVKVYQQGGRRKQNRARRSKPTTESVEKINKRNAERDFAIKINHNFCAGDIYLTLTYKGDEPSKEEARRNLNNFKRRLKYHCDKQGIKLKWVAVTEYENRRIHHHMILNVRDIGALNDLWPHGLINTKPLDDSGDYRILAEYLIKETDKTFRNPDSANKVRFSCSRTIENPEVIQEEIGIIDLTKEPRPVKGFVLDPDSFYYGENPFSGRAYQEYVLIAETAGRKMPRKSRGRKKKYHAINYNWWLYKNAERQLGYIVTEDGEIIEGGANAQ